MIPHSFVCLNIFSHFDFDLDKTIYLFIAGRYEFSNKGADVFIESLARLNYELQTKLPDTTVVAFLIFPAPNNSFNVDSLRGHAVTKTLRDTLNTIQQEIGKRMYDTCLSGRLPDSEELLMKEDKVKIKRCLYALQRDNMPPVTTHNLVSVLMKLILK